MKEPSLRIVHGFCVTSIVFRPLLIRLRRGAADASLFRYPSVGLSLHTIVDRFCRHLTTSPPTGIVAHSLGCIVTIMAAAETGWAGPIAFLAPPFSPLPLTKPIPAFLRFPFAPLLDHRTLLTDPRYRLPSLPNCPKLVIAGRFDITVPLGCTQKYEVDQYHVVPHTHNSMLFSRAVAETCFDWVAS